MIQPHRDLELNFEIDVAKTLEDYLLRICSGEGDSEEDGPPSINFAEGLVLFV